MLFKHIKGGMCVECLVSQPFPSACLFQCLCFFSINQLSSSWSSLHSKEASLKKGCLNVVNKSLGKVNSSTDTEKKFTN